MTGVANAAMPGLPYPGGYVGYPQPMRLLPGPTESTAAGAIVLPIIPIFSPFPPPHLLIEAPGVHDNPISAPVPSQMPKPAPSQTRYEALQLADQQLCDVPRNLSQASSPCGSNAWTV